METGPHDPHTVFEVFFLIKQSVRGGGVPPPRPHESASTAAAGGRRAECVCEAKSELESVATEAGLRVNPIHIQYVGRGQPPREAGLLR